MEKSKALENFIKMIVINCQSKMNMETIHFQVNYKMNYPLLTLIRKFINLV